MTNTKTESFLTADRGAENRGKPAGALCPNSGRWLARSRFVANSFCLRIIAGLSLLGLAIVSSKATPPQSPGDILNLPAVEDISEDISNGYTNYNPYGYSSYGDGSLVNWIYHSEGIPDFEIPPRDQKTAIKFDLSAITGNVGAATLRVFVKDVSNPTLNLWGSLDNSWSEAELSFPATTNVGLGRFTSIETGGWVELDVTSFINDQLAGDRVATFILEADATGDNSLIAVESDEDVNNPPELKILFGAPPAQTNVITSQVGSNAVFSAFSYTFAGPQIITGFRPGVDKIDLSQFLDLSGTFGHDVHQPDYHFDNVLILDAHDNGDGTYGGSYVNGNSSDTGTFVKFENTFDYTDGYLWLPGVDSSLVSSNDFIFASTNFVLPSSLYINRSPYNPTWGQTVDFTVYAGGYHSSTSPVGDIIFFEDTTPLGTNAITQVGEFEGSMGAVFSVASLSVGEHVFYATFAGDTNFFGTTNSALITVSKAPLTITADDQTKLYGAPMPILTMSYTGFVNDDTADSLDSQPELSTTATEASHVAGSPYLITASGATSTNYEISYVAGSLTVTAAPLTITADNQTNRYGSALPTLTASFTGFVNGDAADSLTTQPTLSTSATSSSHVVGSPYAITASDAVDPDYSISYVAGSLAVTPAELTITADNQTKLYGAPVPTLTLSYAGFVNDDTADSLSNQPSLTTSADLTSPIGVYSIIVSWRSSSDYTIAPVDGSLTVTPSPLNVTAGDASRTFGTSNPTFTGTLTGVMNSDPITASYSSEATQESAVGTYSIMPVLSPSANTLSNYDVTSVSGTLTIIGDLAANTNTGFYVIGDPAVLVDTNAMFGDGNGVDFNGATLTLTTVSNAASGDLLSIATGDNAGPVSAAEQEVSLGGTQFGTYTGGSDLDPLVFVFNTNATSAAVTALMQQLTFATTNLATDSREFQFTVTYGATSVSANRTFVLDRPPVARDLEVSVTEGVSFEMLFSQLVANSSDADNDTITVTNISSSSLYGGVLTSSTNSLTYSPPEGGTSGPDLFTYRVDDGRGGQGSATVTLTFLTANRIQLDMSGIQGAGVQLTMSGTPGQAYAVEASTNLVDWTLVGTTTATSTGLIQILDEQAQNYPTRFYRAVSQ